MEDLDYSTEKVVRFWYDGKRRPSNPLSYWIFCLEHYSSPVYRSCTKEEVSGWIPLFSYKEHINIDGTTGHVKRSERDISLTPSIALVKSSRKPVFMRLPLFFYFFKKWYGLHNMAILPAHKAHSTYPSPLPLPLIHAFCSGLWWPDQDVLYCTSAGLSALDIFTTLQNLILRKYYWKIPG